MAKIISFCAIRPRRDIAHLVATRPYYTYKKHIIEAKLEENPYTFMHIIHPEYGLSDKSEANSVERFQKVKEVFEDFLKQDYLFHEEEEALYIYRQTKNNKSYTGVIAGASIEEYNANKIKKHEATLTSREEVFVNYLEITGFNAEPVLLAHAPNKNIQQQIEQICKQRPEYEFSTTDKVKHELWVITGKPCVQLRQAYEKIENLYIADGHHRSASSALLAEKHAKETDNNQLLGHFLAFLIDETTLDILPFHRIANDLNNLSEKDFLLQLSENFDIEACTADQIPKQHEIVIYLHDKWHKISIKQEKIEKNNPVNQLDTQLLTDLILTPILGIKDLKTDKRISFISGDEGTENLIQKVKQTEHGIGFILAPISFNEVKAVADASLIMPPKSTWVEPKLRSGLIIYPIFFNA
jgi:uncharacterized protein (DUF1015 family)